MIHQDKMKSILKRVKKERERQEQLYADRYVPVQVASPNTLNEKRLAVLTEEFLEVVRGVNDSISAAELAIELIQVAAVAVAFVEGLEDEPCNDQVSTNCSLDAVLAAEPHVSKLLFDDFPEVSGIGIVHVGDGWGFKVNLTSSPLKALPGQIDNVPLVLEVVGEVVAHVLKPRSFDNSISSNIVDLSIENRELYTTL